MTGIKKHISNSTIMDCFEVAEPKKENFVANFQILEILNDRYGKHVSPRIFGIRLVGLGFKKGVDRIDRHLCRGYFLKIKEAKPNYIDINVVVDMLQVGKKYHEIALLLNTTVPSIHTRVSESLGYIPSTITIDNSTL